MRPSTRSPAHAAVLAAVPLAALVLVATSGCRPRTGAPASVSPSAGRETLVTEQEIARMSVRTAWDVVRMRAPRIAGGWSPSGGLAGVRIQEPRSVNADETPLLVVDGMQMSDIQYLAEIPAFQVRAIHILDAEAAQPRYGLRAAGGAIVVETKRGP